MIAPHPVDGSKGTSLAMAARRRVPLFLIVLAVVGCAPGATLTASTTPDAVHSAIPTTIVTPEPTLISAVPGSLGEALDLIGPTRHHRLTFEPIAQLKLL